MDKEILKKINIFSELNDNEIDKIFSFSSGKTFCKGEMVFFDTEPYQGFYIVTNGSVKVFKISKDGREHILHFIYPYNTFAEVPLFEQIEKIKKEEFTYPANAMALENNTRLILIPSSYFYNFLGKNSDVCLKMLSGLAKKLRHLNRHVDILTQDVPKRLAKILLQNSSNDCIDLKVSKHDLASYIGTIDETLSRTLKKFQDDEIIKVKGKKIIITDKPLLKKLASDS